MIFQIKLPKEDMYRFCNDCGILKQRGIYVEVWQGNKVVCGSSMVGLGALTYDEPMYFLTHDHVEEKDLTPFSQWRVD